MDEQTKWQSVLIQAKTFPILCWQRSDVKDSCENFYFHPDNEFLTLDLKLPDWGGLNCPPQSGSLYFLTGGGI